MHETLATMRTSRRDSSAAVAAWRSRSISSLIDESFSMYVSVVRDVRLGLVVVVVADEVLDRVVGEDLAELVGELRAERLVGCDHEGRPLERLHHVRDRERLPGAGGAQERQGLLAGRHGVGQLSDRTRLVAGGPEVGGDTERGHEPRSGPRADTAGCTSRATRHMLGGRRGEGVF